MWSVAQSGAEYRVRSVSCCELEPQDAQPKLMTPALLTSACSGRCEASHRAAKSVTDAKHDTSSCSTCDMHAQIGVMLEHVHLTLTALVPLRQIPALEPLSTLIVLYTRRG